MPLPVTCVGRQHRRCSTGSFANRFFIVALLALLMCVVAVEAKGVHVSMSANWTDTPLLQDGCEWMGRQLEPSSFFDCVERAEKLIAAGAKLPRHEEGARGLTQQQQYRVLTQMLMHEDGDTSAPSLSVNQHIRALFEMDMAGRVTAPAVEAHAALATHEVASWSKASSSSSSSPTLSSICRGAPFLAVKTVDGGHITTHLFSTVEEARALVRQLPRRTPHRRDVGDDVRVWASTVLQDFDHVHPSSTPLHAAEAVVVLYGLIGQHTSQAMYRRLMEAVKNDGAFNVLVVYRHLPAATGRVCGGGARSRDVGDEEVVEEVWTQPLMLQGYGATIDFRNMEYKVVDERGGTANHDDGSTTTTTSSSSSSSSPASADVAGFSIPTLKQRHPSLATVLDAFAMELEDILGHTEIAKVDLDVWEMQNIGLAAAQYIAEVKQDKLAALVDLITRFPLHAARLSRMGSTPARLATVREEVMILNSYMKSDEAVLVVNGRLVGLRQLSYFGLLQHLWEEERLYQRLADVLSTRCIAPHEDDDENNNNNNEKNEVGVAHNFPVEEHKVFPLIRKLAALAKASPALQQRRLHVREAYTVWINDIEKEEMYADMPPYLTSLLQQSSRMSSPRRNIMNLVVVVDPSTEEGRAAMMEIIQLLWRGTPVRAGLVIVDGSWSNIMSATTDNDAHRILSTELSKCSKFVMMISAVLHHLGQHRDASGTLIAPFLDRLMKIIAKDFTVQVEKGALLELVEHIANELFQSLSDGTSTTRASARSVQDVLSDGTFLQMYAKTQHSMSVDLRLAHAPAFLINGIPFHSLKELFRNIPEENQRMRQLIAKKIITDRTANLYRGILKHYAASSRAHPALEWEGGVRIPFAHASVLQMLEHRPFFHPTNYVGAIAMVSDVVLFPYATSTVAGLERVANALKAMASCGSSSTNSTQTRRGGRYAALCSSWRLAVVMKEDEEEAEPIISSSVAATLQQLLEGMGEVSEAKRLDGVLEYIQHVLNHTRDAHVDAQTRLAELVVPGEVSESSAKLLKQRRWISAPQLDFQTRIAHAFVKEVRAQLHKHKQQHQTRATTGLSGPILISSGRVTVMDDDLRGTDFLELALQQLNAAVDVHDALEVVNFVELSNSLLSSTDLGSSFFSARIAAISSILIVDAQVRGEANFGMLRSFQPHVEHISFHTNSSAFQASGTNTARYDIVAVVDPTARSAQLVLSLCDVLMRSTMSVALTVLLNPSTEVQRPIRDLFTFVARPSLQFDAASGAITAPAADFRGLPMEMVLTVGVEEPESWNVRATEADGDLDNILLSRLPRGVQQVRAHYQLTALLITGEAAPSTSSASAGVRVEVAGLPLRLTSAADEDGVPPRDTLVMQTLGYYQLPAHPGMWWLSVAPGPHAEAFEISSISGGAQVMDGRAAIVLDSFAGKHLHTDIHQHPGTPTIQEAAISDFIRAKHVWPPAEVGHRASPPSRPTLNIFSVASGHLYERFLRMMMHSVYNSSSNVLGSNTTRIKFWVIENYLSPQFREYVPLLAAELGFEVSFVSYHWPWWLPKQTEKQRKIWAYKILFLDVLFPLDVERVIFVDADQTALADLHELYNLDMHHHPIAMTPFCSDERRNNATNGFRFWEQGFWVSHLHGMPYHISAIFLVDLQHFRALRSADIYRSTYAQLAGDPNSLANLDQDLPNYLQNVVRIYSLPQEWLWCSTWCSSESKATAKTIDLCNNPLTKMPKLDNARMIIDDWEAKDDVLEKLAVRLVEKKHAEVLKNIAGGRK